jgi:hypothetical protein
MFSSKGLIWKIRRGIGAWTESETFEFCRRFQGVLSALTGEAPIPQNEWHLMLETACRKTHDFPVSVRAALIGRLMELSKKG